MSRLRLVAARDKAKVEAAVLSSNAGCSARCDRRRFYSLAELDAAIGELLHQLSEERPIRRLLRGCRA